MYKHLCLQAKFINPSIDFLLKASLSDFTMGYQDSHLVHTENLLNDIGTVQTFAKRRMVTRARHQLQYLLLSLNYQGKARIDTSIPALIMWPQYVKVKEGRIQMDIILDEPGVW